jgi:hypothetical protein
VIVERSANRNVKSPLFSNKTKQMIGSFPSGLLITHLQQRILQVSNVTKCKVAADRSHNRVLKTTKALPA